MATETLLKTMEASLGVLTALGRLCWWAVGVVLVLVLFGWRRS